MRATDFEGMDGKRFVASITDASHNFPGRDDWEKWGVMAFNSRTTPKHHGDRVVLLAEGLDEDVAVMIAEALEKQAFYEDMASAPDGAAQVKRLEKYDA